MPNNFAEPTNAPRHTPLINCYYPDTSTSLKRLAAARDDGSGVTTHFAVNQSDALGNVTVMNTSQLLISTDSGAGRTMA
ncbi:hypothetical protein FC50_GL001068 [Lacticaseibacillus pantheris DSM 15945 = JCM 12539 = NBRC 106106]|uniref:Uncharacterized protein n=1 Tax=Lacticaseibacillus pantheris DSM 15945 = JCM 12539 = NBRC 106106 TaxID=1423783 RepID=A0A0R1U3V5_9LACO|nr:hypothetical protein FC50_GL001068 [Lacticaseibacillus pantheris DSM 15945 = JCM 12539 = NBRC 106106]